MSDYKTMICRKDIDFKANEPYRNDITVEQLLISDDFHILRTFNERRP